MVSFCGFQVNVKSERSKIYIFSIIYKNLVDGRGGTEQSVYSTWYSATPSHETAGAGSRDAGCLEKC